MKTDWKRVFALFFMGMVGYLLGLYGIAAHYIQGACK